MGRRPAVTDPDVDDQRDRQRHTALHDLADQGADDLELLGGTLEEQLVMDLKHQAR